MREGWTECILDDLLIFMTNGSSAKQFEEEVGLPISRIETIWDEKIDFKRVKYVKESEPDFIEKYQILKNDILLSHINSDSHLGKTAIYKNENKVFIHGINLLKLRPSSSINADFLLHQFRFKKIKGDFIAVAQRAVNQSSINQRKLKVFDFILPPLSEQRAIAAKIGELFSDLDKGMAELKKAQDQLKVYRQAVLKKAFEGDYKQIKVIDIAEVKTGATPKRGNSSYWKDGVFSWVTSGALNNLFVNEASELITEKALKETNCKIIKKGALLVAMYGEGKTRGKCSELNIDAATNQAVAAISLFEEYKDSKQFIKWFFIKNYEEIRLLSSGGVQPNLNLSIIKNTLLPFPNLTEQLNIVQNIESHLSVCDKVEQSIKESLEKSEALRQSILKKAFDGGLLSELEVEQCKQEKDYEPANVLLERIKSEKIAKEEADKKVKIKNKTKK